jgi:hypothetical protein
MVKEVIKWQSQADNCDLCGVEFSKQQYFVDGKIKTISQWALMCPKCHLLLGDGIGLGKGQAYDSKTKECISGGK